MPLRHHTMGGRIRAGFTERLGYKAASLFLAVVLWGVVSLNEPADEPHAVWIGRSSSDSGAGSIRSPVIRARVTGQGKEMLKLHFMPMVLRSQQLHGLAVGDSVRIELRPEDIELPAGVEVRVRDIRPRSVMVHVDPAIP